MAGTTKRFIKRVGTLLLLLLLTAQLCACDVGEIPNSGLVTTQATVPTQTTAPAQTTPSTGATDATGAEEEPKLYWVFAQGGLRIRSGPSVEYTMVGSLADGDVVEPLTWKDGWAYIEEPVKGWCSGDYLHELGWFNDVKTPEGEDLKDTSLAGKWVHSTAPAGSATSRAGILRLRKGGTFLHMTGEYERSADGKWTRSSSADAPYWVGEYQFDGRTLELRYMARLEVTYDASGKITKREWVEAVHTVTLEVSQLEKGVSFRVDDPGKLPLDMAFGGDASTDAVLHHGKNDLSTPADVCAVLEQRYK